MQFHFLNLKKLLISLQNPFDSFEKCAWRWHLQNVGHGVFMLVLMWFHTCALIVWRTFCYSQRMNALSIVTLKILCELYYANNPEMWRIPLSSNNPSVSMLLHSLCWSAMMKYLSFSCLNITAQHNDNDDIHEYEYNPCKLLITRSFWC